MDSNVGTRHSGHRAFSEGQIDARDLGFTSRLAQSKRNSLTRSKSKRSSMMIAKEIDPLLYFQLEKRLQIAEEITNFNQPGPSSRSRYTHSAPDSPSATGFGRRYSYSSMTRKGASKHRHDSYEEEKHHWPMTHTSEDTIKTIGKRLAVSLSHAQQRSTNLVLSGSNIAERSGSSISFRHPFIRRHSKGLISASPYNAKPVIAPLDNSIIVPGEHEAFERKLLLNAAVLCEE